MTRLRFMYFDIKWFKNIETIRMKYGKSSWEFQMFRAMNILCCHESHKSSANFNTRNHLKLSIFLTVSIYTMSNCKLIWLTCIVFDSRFSFLNFNCFGTRNIVREPQKYIRVCSGTEHIDLINLIENQIH